MPELPVKGVRLPSLSRSENSSKVIDKGQFVIDSDTGDLYLGDGITTYGSLTAINGGGGGGTSYKSFSEASVDEIKEVIEKGLYRTVYNIGDTRKIELSDGKTYTARIMDFDSLFNSSGQRVHMLIGFDELLANTYVFNSSSTNSGGWKESLLRTNLESLYQANKDNDIFSLCEESLVYTGNSYGIDDSCGWTQSTDHFFIPSLVELFGKDALWNADWTDISNYANGYQQSGHQWEYYKQILENAQTTLKGGGGRNPAFIKYQVGQTSFGPDWGCWYWLRDADLKTSSGFFHVDYYGDLTDDGANDDGCVFLCWCI